MIIPVIILNYNSSKDCKKCVLSLKQQIDVDLEIIVVDNCSSANDLSQTRDLCHSERLTLLENRENSGYNAGNNIGLRYAAEKGYKYAIITNPDMEFPQKDYLLQLAMQMEADSKIVICASDIVSIEGIHQNPMKQDGNWLNSLAWVKSVLSGHKVADTYDFIDNYQENHYCSKVSGCCFMISIQFLKKIIFFDEYPFLYCEEAILSSQVRRAGCKMYYLADCQAIHAHQKSEKGDPVKRFKHWKRSRIYYYRNYSSDSWIGKQISILSMILYVATFVMIHKIRTFKK